MVAASHIKNSSSRFFRLGVVAVGCVCGLTLQCVHVETVLHVFANSLYSVSKKPRVHKSTQGALYLLTFVCIPCLLRRTLRRADAQELQGEAGLCRIHNVRQVKGEIDEKFTAMTEQLTSSVVLALFRFIRSDCSKRPSSETLQNTWPQLKTHSQCLIQHWRIPSV
jgi:hypothetical protein